MIINNLEPETAYSFKVALVTKRGNIFSKTLHVKTPKGNIFHLNERNHHQEFQPSHHNLSHSNQLQIASLWDGNLAKLENIEHRKKEYRMTRLLTL
jgi:hypothetical protein